MIEWGHTAVEVIGTISGTTVPIALYIWANKRQAVADAERRHREQQAVLNGLVTERRYFPAHKHKENSGPLTAENIDYPPKQMQQGRRDDG